MCSTVPIVGNEAPGGDLAPTAAAAVAAVLKARACGVPGAASRVDAAGEATAPWWAFDESASAGPALMTSIISTSADACAS
jgi:hypothetical protein